MHIYDPLGEICQMTTVMSRKTGQLSAPQIYLPKKTYTDGDKISRSFWYEEYNVHWRWMHYDENQFTPSWNS